MIHKLKIEPLDIGHAKVYVDGNPISCSKVDVHMEVGCMHTTDITMCGEPELEYDSLVTYEFTPKTVECAVKVLKAALQKKDIVAFLGMNELNRVISDV